MVLAQGDGGQGQATGGHQPLHAGTAPAVGEMASLLLQSSAA